MRNRLLAGITSAASLDEPTRRRLYAFVVRQPEPVGRDDAAAALGLPRTTAAFHLDRLVDAGLLDVIQERRSGRRGPGAGRPAKLYRRAAREIEVSLPERRYDLVGRLLAGAVDEATSSGRPVGVVLEQRAYAFGRTLAEGGDTADADCRPSGLADDGPAMSVVRVLEAHGYEPRSSDTGITLGNCPFNVLAREYTELVCGANLCLLSGVLDAHPDARLEAELRPGEAGCCVHLVPALPPTG
ncbi:helix-turn-helix transcriptional regulator [Pseudonocardia dioxanivorans]|jgi:predicted ArsR family transcriptional regulator|uniref:helix-turn-helix transcriptional regulator n=1 Tax=Pseudonocardia dioxanivorans TaxID=240495 RepID=UPI000CD0A999|nr:helix-turn-helix domain-containing protein [Pseudonocardia dioxanivorans]